MDVLNDKACWDCDNREFLIDYTAYCNQAGMFKKLTFEQFMEKRTPNAERRLRSVTVYKNNMKD